MNANLRRLLIDRAVRVSFPIRCIHSDELFTGDYYHKVASNEIANDWPDIIWC